MSDELGCATRLANSLSENNDECFPKCPLECFKMKFEVSYLENSWYAPLDLLYWFPDYFDSFMTDKLLTENSLELQILYDDLAYVEILEEPKMNSKDLLAEIGGHLHLFLGMSLLSFIELFELILFSRLKNGEKAKKLIDLKDAENIKMDAIPNAIRSPHVCLSTAWIVLFVCASGACVYLVSDTIRTESMAFSVITLRRIFRILTLA